MNTAILESAVSISSGANKMHFCSMAKVAGTYGSEEYQGDVTLDVMFGILANGWSTATTDDLERQRLFKRFQHADKHSAYGASCW